MTGDGRGAGRAEIRNVRQDVLDAVLLARIPPGSVLTRKDFASVSRARPDEVAACLEVLERMGLVDTDGDKVRISPCDINAVLAHVERRRELEIAIVRAAALKATDVQLEAMKASEMLQSRCALVGDMDGLMIAERHLESLLLAASGLTAEGEELSRIKVEFRRSWCAANRLKTFTNVANIRTALVAAIVARDSDAAEDQVKVFFDHLLRTY